MKKLLPGKALAKEFLKPRCLTPDQLGHAIGVPVRHIDEIVRGSRAITFEILFRLDRYLGPSVEEWWRILVTLYDLERSTARYKWVSAEVKWSAARYKSSLAVLKRFAAHDKSLWAHLKQSAAHYESLLGELKQSEADDERLSAELEKFYAVAKMRLLALLRFSR